MLKTLQIENFTVFSETEFEFSPGLNVVIGENSTGKTLLLRLGYVVAYVMNQALQDARKGGPDRTRLGRVMAEKLIGVFRPDKLGMLCRSGQGRQKALIRANLSSGELVFSFSANSRTTVQVDEYPEFSPDTGSFQRAPLFLPSREVLSIYPGFTSLHKNGEITADETLYDLCRALSSNPLKGERAREVSHLVKPLEEIIGGRVRLRSDRFCLETPEQGDMGIPLVGEGARVVGALSRLISTGALRKNATLFWDEPDAALNPRFMVRIAQMLIAMAKLPIQTIITTHSYFLMNELGFLIESSGEMIPCQFFSLRKEGGNAITLEKGDAMDDLQTIVSLDEGLEQHDRKQEWFYGNIEA